MAGKYMTGMGPGGIFSSNSGVCSTAAASSGAVAYDGPTTFGGKYSPVYRSYGIPDPVPPVDLLQKMCWKVTGREVIIDAIKSIQYGFEMVNFNFHTNGTQPALPTFAALSVGGMG